MNQLEQTIFLIAVLEEPHCKIPKKLTTNAHMLCSISAFMCMQLRVFFKDSSVALFENSKTMINSGDPVLKYNYISSFIDYYL